MWTNNYSISYNNSYNIFELITIYIKVLYIISDN